MLVRVQGSVANMHFVCVPAGLQEQKAQVQGLKGVKHAQASASKSIHAPKPEEEHQVRKLQSLILVAHIIVEWRHCMCST